MATQQQFIETLETVPLGKKALDDVRKLGFSVSFEKAMSDAGSCDASKKTIMLNANLKLLDLLPTFVHEARHAVQSEILPIKDEQTRCADMIKGYRAMEADAVAHEAAFVHQACESGLDVKSSRLTQAACGAYKHHLKYGEKEAMNQAFQSWYSDKETLNLYDDFYAEQITLIGKKCAKDQKKGCFMEKISDTTVLKVCPYVEKGFLASPEAFSMRSTAKETIDFVMETYARKTKSSPDKSVLAMYSRAKNGKITDDRVPETPSGTVIGKKTGPCR